MSKSDKALRFISQSQQLRVRVCLFSLLVSIKELEKEKLSLQSESESYTDQVPDTVLVQLFVILSVNFRLLLS